MSDAMKPILVIGSLNMDLVARCERLPAKGQTVFGQDFFTAPGGKGANQAVAAAKLGARVTMAGCVGTDAFGAALTAGLRAEGIGTDTVVPVVGPTGTALTRRATRPWSIVPWRASEARESCCCKTRFQPM